MFVLLLNGISTFLGYFMSNPSFNKPVKVKLATVFEGDPMAPLSIATTPMSRGGRYSIPWLVPLYPWSLPHNAESYSLWQGWNCWLVHCPGGNATDPIWRVLDSSNGISSWTPLKSQHSITNPNPLSNQHSSIDFLTLPTPLIPLKNWCSIHARWSKSSLKHSIRLCGIFSKHNFIAYRSSKVSSRPDCIIEIHQPWQSDISRVYSNSFCSSSFEAEIINIGHSSGTMYCKNILNF